MAVRAAHGTERLRNLTTGGNGKSRENGFWNNLLPPAGKTTFPTPSTSPDYSGAYRLPDGIPSILLQAGHDAFTLKKIFLFILTKAAEREIFS
ncbi:hypothetical protein HMPREF3038_02597 [Akkermansia sp. KLE1797]|nr:hypothetical protein HMPREF3038_02597 [Akkermansia sp. KLE1797]KXU52986.1 hypothetical protein HMPREF3039_02855 [Akkermansia sp. KLE1798]KZA03626.1 hypothetical protein HMPREF1326_02714 [Akkermansia sp. KLE1605]